MEEAEPYENFEKTHESDHQSGSASGQGFHSTGAASRKPSTNTSHRTRSHVNSGGLLGETVSTNDREQTRDAERGDPEKDGFEVQWDGGERDPLNPRSWGKARKWMVVIICSMTSVCVACTSSIYSETYAQMEREFNTSEEVATVGLTLFVVGLGCGPVFLTPLSEFFGRRPVYVAAMPAFVIWLQQ